jgi:hypothetical protein
MREFCQINASVWTYDDEIEFAGLCQVPARCTLIHCGAGTLVVFSPLRVPRDKLTALLGQLGVDKVIVVAPNAMHHMFVHVFCDELLPRSVTATIVASPALKRRFPERRWDRCLDANATAPTQLADDGALLAFCVPGFGDLDEVVLLHKPTKTLVCCDLAFNFSHEQRGRMPLMARAYLRLFASTPACVSWPFRFMIDAPTMMPCMAEIMRHDFDTLVMAHGAVVLSGGKAALRDGTCRFVEDLARPVSTATKVALAVAAIAAAAVGVRAWLR